MGTICSDINSIINDEANKNNEIKVVAVPDNIPETEEAENKYESDCSPLSLLPLPSLTDAESRRTS